MKTNVALGIVLAALVAANLMVDPDPGVPNRDYLPQMAYSQAAESYAASDILPLGRVMQRPPAGTVARGASLPIQDPTPAGAIRAGEELRSPEMSDKDLERGAQVYATFCTPCHGSGGLGDGAVVKRGYPAPPSLLAQRAVEMPDGRMFHIVTFGQVNMPGYAAQVDEADRWRVLALVRRMQRSSR